MRRQSASVAGRRALDARYKVVQPRHLVDLRFGIELAIDAESVGDARPSRRPHMDVGLRVPNHLRRRSKRRREISAASGASGPVFPAGRLTNIRHEALDLIEFATGQRARIQFCRRY